MPSGVYLESLPKSERNFGLDLFRALAIIFVVIGHGGFMLNGTRFESFPYVRLVDGVEMFFVLSGFLIGGILLREINKEKFGFAGLRSFWVRRWFRTLPNYYLILGANYVVVSTGIIKEDLSQFSWKFFFFLHNFSQPSYGFFWESWSLSIEEWFYLSTPLALTILLTKVKPRMAFLIVIGLMIGISIAYRLHHLDVDVDRFWYDTIFKKIVLMRLDSIAFGLLAAWVHYYHHPLWVRFRKMAFAAGLLLVWIAVHDSTPVNTFYRKVLYMTFSSFSIMLLMPLVESWKAARGWLVRRVTHISRISYSMYLINLALVAEVIRDNFPPQGGMDGLMKYAIFWAVTLGASTLLYAYFEKPMMNLRDRFSQKETE